MYEYLLTRANEFSRLLVARFARLKRSSASEMSCTEMQISVQASMKNKMDVLARSSSPDLREFLSWFVHLAIRIRDRF